jgi:D-alanine--poly(phosphoribitol) ligase subunit 2
MENTTAVESRMVELVTRTLADLEEQGVVDLGGEPVEAGSALFGETGLLDSVGLVSLVVALEQEIEDQFGEQVSLADERALSQRNSPYRTVSTLADYAAGLLGTA